MNYFIDFEATQYHQEIIQIGCVREDGEAFKSLVRPRKPKHITKFILQLTGLDRKSLMQAPSSDEVFSDFLNWLMLDRTPVKFYCYGGADLIFVQNNLQKCTNDVKAQAALSLIIANLTDFSNVVEEHFRLQNAPSLKKVMQYYYPNDTHVCHDALADADMLRHVHDALIKEDKVNGVPFPDHVGMPMFKSIDDFDRFNIVRQNSQQNRTTYQSFDNAVSFLINHAKRQRVDLDPTCAQKKLIAAINSGKPYYGYVWIAEVKRESTNN